MHVHAHAHMFEQARVDMTEKVSVRSRGCMFFCSIPEIKCRYASVHARMCVRGRATSVCLRARTLARVLTLCMFAQTPSFRVMT